MNIIIAMDSFKGSLSSLEAGNITARAAQAVFPDAGVSRTPLRQAVTVLPPHPQEFLSFSPDYFDKH